MKRASLLISFVGLFVILFGTLFCAGSSQRFSPSTQRLITLLDKKSSEGESLVFTEAEMKRFLVTQKGDVYIVHGIISVDDEFNPADLEKMGVIISQRQENRLSASIPIALLKQLGKMRGIRFIEVDTTVHQRKNLR